MTSRMKLVVLMLLAVIGLSFAQGCTVYKAAVDERSMGQLYDDEAITFEMERKFLADEVVKYLDFTAYSYLGHAYIVGEYENQAQIDRAKSIARGIAGVRTVTTYLLPKPKSKAACGTMAALEIGARVDKDLLADDTVYGTNVDTQVVQCNVVLLGRVGSQAELNRAIAIAKKVPGVRSVKSFYRSTPTTNDNSGENIMKGDSITSSHRRLLGRGLVARGCLLCLTVLMLTGCGLFGKSHLETTSRRQGHASSNHVVVQTVRSVLGTPYKWGGDSPQEGFDCSGLMYWAFTSNGVRIPRVSWEQVHAGQKISRSDIQAGDLVFFDTGQSRGYHVGLATGNGTFLHSPKSGSRVAESSLNGPYWYRKFLVARRVADPRTMALR